MKKILLFVAAGAAVGLATGLIGHVSDSEPRHEGELDAEPGSGLRMPSALGALAAKFGPLLGIVITEVNEALSRVRQQAEAGDEHLGNTHDNAPADGEPTKDENA